MKRVTIAISNAEGKLAEKTVFVDAVADAKKEEGFRAILEHGRVKHPSPEILTLALAAHGIDIAGFYRVCDEKAAELAKAPANADNNEISAASPSAADPTESETGAIEKTGKRNR